MDRLQGRNISDQQLTQQLFTVLGDAPRPGTPATFTTEQVVQSEALLRSADRILEFINYFNRTMSKPFQWKYNGCKKAD